jgi:hypothetical protein
MNIIVTLPHFLAAQTAVDPFSKPISSQHKGLQTKLPDQKGICTMEEN